jgi:hypothetical protein
MARRRVMHVPKRVELAIRKADQKERITWAREKAGVATKAAPRAGMR